MISLSELRRELRLPATEDDRVEAIRAEVIDLWETETGRLWNQRTGYVEVIEPDSISSQNALLELYPVTGLTQVQERSATESTWTTVAATEYELLAPRTLHRFASAWSKSLRVTYTGGYADAPADVKRALLLQARYLIDRTSDAKLVVQSQNFEGGAGVFLAADLHPFFKSLAASKARRA